MPTTDLNILLKARDTVTKPISGIQRKLQSFTTSFKKNWIAIAASVTGAVVALRKAWDLAELGAKAKQIEDSFDRMATSMEIDAQKMRRALQQASAETTNFSNIAAQASALMAQGLNMDTVVALMRQARAEAKLFGSTTEEAFRNVASAVTGGLVTTLRRSYGLQLSLKDAVDNYAKSTGLAREEVQKFHLASAIANEILEKGVTHLKAANLEMKTQYERIQTLKARWLSLQEIIGQFILKIVDGFDFLFSKIAQGQAFLMIAWLNALNEMGFNLDDKLELWANLWVAYGVQAKKAWDSLSGSAKVNLGAIEKKMEETVETFSLVNELMKKIAIDTDKVILSGFVNVVKGLEYLWGDVFYKIFTGTLTGLGDAFAAFGQSVLRILAQVIAKMLVVWAIGKILGAFSGGSISSAMDAATGGTKAFASFATGTPYVPATGLALVHKGEKITPAHQNNQGGSLIQNFFITAWDVGDMAAKKNLIMGWMREGLRSNAPMRYDFRRYT